MPIDSVTNFAKVTLSVGYAIGDLILVLVGGDGAKLPAPITDGAFNLVWWNSTDYTDPSDDSDVEIVRCTARAADTITVTRAQEGTAESNHNTGGKTYQMILAPTKRLIDELKKVLESNRQSSDDVIISENYSAIVVGDYEI
jgi:hypothetical protein